MSKEELRAEMIRHKDTNETLADYLGISAAALSLKMTAKRDFKLSELQKIKQRYDLTASDMARIFFASEVA